MANQGFVRVTQYCVHCEKRQDMTNIKVARIRTKKGLRRQAKGQCIGCGAQMVKILPTK